MLFNCKEISKKYTAQEIIDKTIAAAGSDKAANAGFERFLNNKRIYIADSTAMKYSESVNSVHYFALLPYGLNDAAVKKKLLKPVAIKGKEYYKIEISFDKENGGKDFEDIFIYWIDKQNFTIDYLAYKFQVNGGGMRFREATDENIINGIRFVNYNNYKPKEDTVSISNLDLSFMNDKLIKLSEIYLENIKVAFLEE
ncbi:MAG: deoxyribose-phosphate aldolase [Flavobacteriaceae bacterium]|nr:MAG: deoxyribose-phosphate aldolase [Flavobacteriaceae bacterium]